MRKETVFMCRVIEKESVCVERERERDRQTDRKGQ